MSVNSAVAIWLPLLLACYFIFSHLWSRLAYAQNVKKHGCSRPTRYPHKDFIFGLDLFRLRKISVQEGSTLSFSTQQFKRYGATYEAVEWGRRLIFTSDPRTIQSVLALQCENFGVAPIRKHSRRNWLGPGIITTDGETWNHSRSLLKPVFARARFADLSTFEHHVSEMIGLIPRDGSPVDLQSLLKRLVSVSKPAPTYNEFLMSY